MCVNNEYDDDDFKVYELCCVCGGGTHANGTDCENTDYFDIAPYGEYPDPDDATLESVPDMFEILTSGCANTSPCIVLKDQCDDTSVDGGNCPLPGQGC